MKNIPDDQEIKIVYGGYFSGRQSLGQYYEKLCLLDEEFYGQFDLSEDDKAGGCNWLHQDSAEEVRKNIENFKDEQDIKCFLTPRDQALLYGVISRYQECHGETLILDDHITSGVSAALDELANKLRRRKKQNKCEFICLRGFVRRVNENKCQKYCAKALLLLTFKYYDITTNAGNKRYTLEWLAQPKISDGISLSFDLEDCWYYEMETGINIGAELSAYWDELCSVYRNSAAMKACREEIFDVIVKCICNNYNYIALVPAIDWKINSMKCAMKGVVAILVEAIDLYYKEQDEHKKITSDRAIYNLCLTWQRGKKKSGDRESEEDARFAEEVLQYELSRRFNEILCQLVIDELRKYDIFDLKENTTLPMREFMRPKTANKFHDLGRNSDTLPLYLWTKAEDWITGVSGERIPCIHAHPKDLVKQMEELTPRGDLLVFCNRENEYIQMYLEEAQGRGALPPSKGVRFQRILAALTQHKMT